MGLFQFLLGYLRSLWCLFPSWSICLWHCILISIHKASHFLTTSYSLILSSASLIYSKLASRVYCAAKLTGFFSTE
ncbi:hypothetical protein XELAEV_18039907mg [Xenopus laevis]|uniref:Uncharacterized protein n=1 Tax=Xenopus laevis TaxID=8355 RepID=A0A974C8M4_XENLA|nr:hypothetical protein XELAEV_18039907mg [Xenopus laevis]